MLDPHFINSINRYFNYGYLDKTGKLAAMLFPEFSMKFQAHRINSLHNTFKNSAIAASNSEINLPYYDGKIETINAIGQYLQTHLNNELAHAIIHGSIATGEVRNYSDFDGLIILKDEIFTDPQRIIHTAKHLNKSFKMMLSFDPHQHHGWIILTESHLKKWPCFFFPPEILNHSKSFKGFNPEFSFNFNEEYSKETLVRHCNRITSSISKSGFPSNVFQLKSLLSEFMLLPSIYIQVKTGKGVFKKLSFEMAAADFTKSEWQVMELISEIRILWPDFRSNYTATTSGYFTPFTRYNQIHDKSKLPSNITIKLNDQLAINMVQLSNQIKNKF